MVDDTEAESDLCIPYKEFASIMEQNKILQETALHLREENHLLSEENRSLLNELEVTSNLMHMLEQRNTELIAIQAREDREELLSQMSLLGEEMMNLKAQHEAVVLALDYERQVTLEKERELQRLNNLWKDDRRDVIIRSLGRRIAELESDAQTKSCRFDSDGLCHSACIPLCNKALSHCVETDLSLLHYHSHLSKLFAVLEQNRHPMVSDVLPGNDLSEVKGTISSLHGKLSDANTSLMDTLQSELTVLAGSKDPKALGAANGMYFEAVGRQVLHCVQDAFSIERATLKMTLDRLQVEKNCMVDMFDKDIARLCVLRSDISSWCPS